jgi:hypothetical protein
MEKVKCSIFSEDMTVNIEKKNPKEPTKKGEKQK